VQTGAQHYRAGYHKTARDKFFHARDFGFSAGGTRKDLRALNDGYFQYSRCLARVGDALRESSIVIAYFGAANPQRPHCKPIPRAARDFPPLEAPNYIACAGAKNPPPPGAPNYSVLRRCKQFTHLYAFNKIKYPNKSSTK
jgi:hypothetical protein